MSELQAQVIQSLDGLSEDSLYFLLNMIEKFMKPEKNIAKAEQSSTGGIKIGLFKGEKYIADDYDFDEDNNAIANLFEDAV